MLQFIATGELGSNPATMDFFREWKGKLEVADVYFENPAKCMKKWVDRGRWDEEFQVGEHVLLKVGCEQFIPPKGVTSSLMRKYDSPFEILEKVGKVAYRLRVPEHLQSYHLVFHVSQMRRC